MLRACNSLPEETGKDLAEKVLGSFLDAVCTRRVGLLASMLDTGAVVRFANSGATFGPGETDLSEFAATFTGEANGFTMRGMMAQPGRAVAEVFLTHASGRPSARHREALVFATLAEDRLQNLLVYTGPSIPGEPKA